MLSKGGFELEFEGDRQPQEHSQRSLNNLVSFSEKTGASQGYDFAKLCFYDKNLRAFLQSNF